MSTERTLAIDGGAPLVPEGPPPWPHADEAVRAALDAALADGSWGRYDGPHGARLATALAERHGIEHVVLCSSGTFAVELALRAAKIGPGDEVLLAGYDFSGNFRAIEAVGASPVLVDIDPATWCLDLRTLVDARGPQTRAVIVSHLHGGLVPMAEARRLADQFGLCLIEDACQAPGAIVDGRPAGSWGDVGVLSFGGSKLLTAGRGGAIVVRDPAAAQRAKVYCERGNHAFPLSELQAAVLLPQVARLAERNRQRAAAVERLLSAWSVAALRPLARPAHGDAPSFYKVPWLFARDHAGNATREAFLAAVRAEGVALDEGFRGFVRRSARRCRQGSTLEHSERAASNTVLLHHPVLLEPLAMIDRVRAALEDVARCLTARAQKKEAAPTP